MKKQFICCLLSLTILCTNALPVQAGTIRTRAARARKMMAAEIAMSKDVNPYSLISTKDLSENEKLTTAMHQVAIAIDTKIPNNMKNYFMIHHGTIYVGDLEGGVGYTELAIDDNDRPMIPDTVSEDHPMNMYIGTDDVEYGFLDDYVIHEFGHVFDARYGITRDPENDAIIASEIPAIVKANEGTSTNPDHYSTTPEAFAQVYAAYRGGDDIVSGKETLAAAPRTLSLIKKYERYSVE